MTWMDEKDRDRRHFQAIADAMDREKREQIERAARDDTGDGILVGAQMAALFEFDEHIEALERARCEAQIGLARRWAELHPNDGRSNS